MALASVRSATSCYNPEVALTAEPGRLPVPHTASSIDKTSAGKRQRGGAVRPTVLQPQPASNRHNPFTSNRFCFTAKSSFSGADFAENHPSEWTQKKQGRAVPRARILNNSRRVVLCLVGQHNSQFWSDYGQLFRYRIRESCAS